MGDGNSDLGAQLRVEPIYDSFLCPLTKQVMHDPVTLETGRTYEREAIEKWLRECRESGRRPVCPLTLRELKSSELSPSIALRHTIKEWNARNEASKLDMARRSLSLTSLEGDILHALKFVQRLCLQAPFNKRVVHDADLIPKIVDVLKSSSRQVRCTALETLRIVVEDDSDNKEIVGEGDTVRTIVKFLSHEQSKEREEAVSLLYELSNSERLCEKIGSVNGAVLILVGMATSNSESPLTVEMTDKTLENLARCENNVKQMAECGRLQPLLTLLLEGASDTKLSMAAILGELVLDNEVKVFVARTAAFSLINLMTHTDMPAREAALKAINQISSDETSAKVLIEAGIMPPLVKDLFTVGTKQLPMRLKEVSATILANVVNSGHDFDSVPIGPNYQTLVSKEIIHNLLHLINNTGPAIESKLLQVLVGLTNSAATVSSVVSAIKSSGATISLVQFIEAPQVDLRAASIRLLQNLSPHMGPELASCLRGPAGQLGSLIREILEKEVITEEQAAAVGFLSDLPERDSVLTRQMLDEGVFQRFISRIVSIRQGTTRRNRFMTPYLEGLVKVVARVTFVLSEESGAAARALCYQTNLALLFIDLLQSNGLDNLQMVSAVALENLSKESKNLTQLLEFPAPGLCATIFPCLSQQPVMTGVCPIHRGICLLKETFCLLDGQAVDKLVALLDHTNDKVVEASLAALATLLEDGVDIDQGVQVLLEAEGVKLILNLLVGKRTETLRSRVVWTVERLLRCEAIANDVASDLNISTALVDAFQHGEYRTRQIAERALKHVDKIPNFSSIFPNVE
ncbi:hypothetical protein SASPL_131492 [Salvia splendens]|uniref:RING-type E3 ubiquitin transferase n=1 Tax=Salvia splendens TaxID=180675 RepID=A0A8X8ZLM4_SALSN|nr:U-box domain-containing protein 43-like [Salvia splendens]KAG6408479.1 hypothetical protein SASPL_131492 [Salvia splendens]